MSKKPHTYIDHQGLLVTEHRRSVRYVLSEIGWDLRTIFRSRRVTPNGPAVWVRYRFVSPYRAWRAGFRRV